MLLRKPRQAQRRAVVAPNQHSRALLSTATFGKIHRRSQRRIVRADHVEKVRAMRATAAASAAVTVVH
jgi:hypothetical protein